jgi:hypothetical protein
MRQYEASATKTDASAILGFLQLEIGEEYESG